MWRRLKLKFTGTLKTKSGDDVLREQVALMLADRKGKLIVMAAKA